MKHQTKAQVLRVYVGEQDQFHGGPLYAAVVTRLKEIGIAGVTVIHGMEGYGAHKQLHTTRFENLFQGLPMLIEAVDVADRISIAVAALDEMIVEGLITIQDVDAIRYVKDPKA